MRNYHIGLGWDDIAQHLTIDPLGICWTGRNWNLAPASQKGRNGTPNAGPFMIEMVGDFDQGQDALDGDQRRAVCAVVGGLLDQCGLEANDIYFHRELGSTRSCPGTGVDKKQLVTEILAAFNALHAIPARGGARSSAGKKPGGAKRPEAKPLPLPPEFLVSRDVADPVGAPAAGYEDHEVREDRLAARTIAEESAHRALLFSDVRTVVARGADEWRELRPYVVNLTEGKLSRTGEFKMDDESIADIIAGIRDYAESTSTPRLMLHAHGGLVSEKSALGYAKGAYSWWLRHGVYPVYFIWETGAFEIIKDRLGLGRGLGDWWDRHFERFARPLGRPLWDDMKDYALKSSAANAGGGEPGGARIFAQALQTLLASPPGGKPITVHAVGHSAGAIFHSHFVSMLIDGAATLDSLALLAPAVRIDLFKQMVVPHLASGKVARFEMFTMDEEAEKDDDLIEPLGIPVYGKSLLYLVSNAFEPETKKAAILGLQERFERDSDIVNLFKPTGAHPDEADRYDEALVPIDYTSGALLLDDDLASVYRRLPDGAVLTLFMDCCHSGTNSRFAPIDRTSARGDEGRRFLQLTPDLEKAHRQFRAGTSTAEPTSAEESLPGVIHFAACLDNQFAYESGGQGHFTRVAAAALAAAVKVGQTNEQFGNDVAAQVIGLGRPQTPRLMRLPAGLDRLELLADRGGAASMTGIGLAGKEPSPGAPLDDRAMAEWCLRFFEAGAAHWRQRLGV